MRSNIQYSMKWQANYRKMLIAWANGGQMSNGVTRLDFVVSFRVWVDAKIFISFKKNLCFSKQLNDVFYEDVKSSNVHNIVSQWLISRRKQRSQSKKTSRSTLLEHPEECTTLASWKKTKIYCSIHKNYCPIK